MKKVVICLAVLFLCSMGVLAAGVKKEGTVETVENDVMNVVIFTDEGEKTREAAKAICDKIQAVMVDIKKLEEKDLVLMIEKADLVLVGSEEGNIGFFEKMDCIFNLEAMNDKRTSLFLLGGSERSLETWKDRIEERKSEIFLLPSLTLSWKEDEREEELSCIDGWLTTAFTY